MLKTANFNDIKNALSVVSGNPISNRNLILQGMARSIGYDSFEQAKALNDRHEAIKNNAIWVDYAPCFSNSLIKRKFIIQVGLAKINAFLVTEKETHKQMFALEIYDIGDEQKYSNFSIDLGRNGYVTEISKDNLTVKDDKVVFNIANSEITIAKEVSGSVFFISVYEKHNENYDNRFSHSPKNKLILTGSSDEFDYVSDSSEFSNPKVQVPRIIYECMGVASKSIADQLESMVKPFNCTMHDVFEAACYYHYQNLNSLFDDDIYPVEKPTNLTPKAMYAVAYHLLSKVIENGDVRDELMESMSLNHEMLEDLLQLTNHEYQWFVATN